MVIIQQVLQFVRDLLASCDLHACKHKVATKALQNNVGFASQQCVTMTISYVKNAFAKSPCKLHARFATSNVDKNNLSSSGSEKQIIYTLHEQLDTGPMTRLCDNGANAKPPCKLHAGVAISYVDKTSLSSSANEKQRVHICFNTTP